jgi:acetyl esterase/lipase
LPVFWDCIPDGRQSAHAGNYYSFHFLSFIKLFCRLRFGSTLRFLFFAAVFLPLKEKVSARYSFKMKSGAYLHSSNPCGCHFSRTESLFTRTMKLILFLLMFCFFLGTNAVCAQTQPAKLVTWQDLMQLPTPAAGKRIAYGPDSLQFGELRLPEGKGTFPVVVIIHGGCWLSQYNYQYMNHVSAALAKAGFATWNIEFRRVGNPGGGYPGTFQDIAQAADYVRELAKQYPVSSKDVLVMGHSAGGHLALWAAGRKDLPKNSPLYTSNPVKVKGVVSLAGIPDLATYSTEQGSCNAAVEQLMGGSSTSVPQRYIEATPSAALALRTPVRMVQGARDPIVPVSQAQNFVNQASSSKNKAKLVLLPEAGHFDLVAPTSPVWPAIEQAVKDLLMQK